jgi:hypothetical protein
VLDNLKIFYFVKTRCWGTGLAGVLNEVRKWSKLRIHKRCWHALKSNEFYFHLKIFLDSKHDTHNKFWKESNSGGSLLNCGIITLRWNKTATVWTGLNFLQPINVWLHVWRLAIVSYICPTNRNVAQQTMMQIVNTPLLITMHTFNNSTVKKVKIPCYSGVIKTITIKIL